MNRREFITVSAAAALMPSSLLDAKPKRKVYRIPMDKPNQLPLKPIPWDTIKAGDYLMFEGVDGIWHADTDAMWDGRDNTVGAHCTLWQPPESGPFTLHPK